jgi:hypothetical protein
MIVPEIYQEIYQFYIYTGKMKRLFFFVILLSSGVVLGQKNSVIALMNFVKIKNNKWNEALYFYENNWKVYREIALEKKYILSYEFLTTKTDSAADFNCILITEYTDSLQFQLSEERFNSIIKELRPKGPKLLDDVQPNEFRQNVFAKKAEILGYGPTLRD